MLYAHENKKYRIEPFLQDTHSSSDSEVDWKKEWEGNIILSHWSSVSRGVAVLFSSLYIAFLTYICEL